MEFEPNEQAAANVSNTVAQKFPLGNIKARPAMTEADIDKFDQHFSALFESSNLPGPDYYEFWKMMETLEAHVPDEKARMAAVFATLSIQGLSKQKLLETAAQYRLMVEKDRNEFEKAANEKALQEVQGRQQQLTDLEKKIAQHAETIKKLTEEITAAQLQTGQIKAQIAEHDQKITSSRQGYQLACDAMINKIETDLQKIQTTL